MIQTKWIAWGTAMACLMAGCAGNGNNNADDTNEEVTGEEIVAKTLKIDISGAVPMEGNLDETGVINFDEDVENVMGVPQSVVVKGDTIYAIESYMSPGFFAYLNDGRQLMSYCSVGSGPEDVVSPFCLKVTDTQISAYDFGAKNLITLDKNGKFKESINLPMTVTAAMRDNSGGIWLDYSNQEFETTKLAWKANADAEEIEILPVPEHLKRFTIVGMQTFSTIYDGSINYLPTLEPKVYRLKNGKAALKYQLDFNGLWPNEGRIQKEFGGNAWVRNIRNFPVDMDNIIETEQWLVLSFKIDSNHYLYLYDKKSNIGKTCVDKSSLYYTPKDIVGDNMYILRKDDTLAVIKLTH